MSIDSIGDFLTIIRNAIMASKPSVVVPYSRIRYEIAKILLQEGFVDSIQEQGQGIEKKLVVVLRYVNGESVIHEIKRVSTPGRRSYAHVYDLKPIIGGLGISILTTSKGLMTNKQAKQLAVGGEVLCTVW